MFLTKKNVPIVLIVMFMLLGTAAASLAAEKQGPAQPGHAAGRRDVKTGDKAPDFTLAMYPGDDSCTLSDQLGRGTLVLYFYPGDDTPLCTQQAKLFRDNVAEFGQAGARIYGVSSDTVLHHAVFAQKCNLTFGLLADPDNKLRLRFGMPDGKSELQARATYIIDRDGIVRHTILEAKDMPRHVSEALDWAQRLAGPHTSWQVGRH